LNKGLTSENFKLSGNILVDSILLKIYVSEDKTHGALIFKTLDDITAIGIFTFQRMNYFVDFMCSSSVFIFIEEES